jgi:hypothetical protein
VQKKWREIKAKLKKIGENWRFFEEAGSANEAVPKMGRKRLKTPPKCSVTLGERYTALKIFGLENYFF